MNNVAISLKKVRKDYTKGKISVPVLNNFDLEIGQGEFVSIMGPSGTGKSTLLNIISGLDRPDSGEVIIGGENILRQNNNASAEWRAHNLGFVFQSYHLIPVLTAAQNVELPLLLTNCIKEERKLKVHTALVLVGLEDKDKNFPSELSGGQEQRVAIARAIVSDPKILICDEPTGGLDRATSNEILEILKILNEAHGKTIVMVTHDAEAASYSSRKIMLEKQTAVSSPE